MKNLLFLIAIIFTGSLWAQKEYSISDKFPQAWAPLSAGEVNIHSTLMNNAVNPGDSTFWIEFVDVNVPSSWSYAICTDLLCYSVSSNFKEKFHKQTGKPTDLKAILTFSSTAGTGVIRFLVYRDGLRNLGDTITYTANAPATGIDKTSKFIDVTIFPNPCKNKLALTLSDENVSSLSIINAVGQELMWLDVNALKTFDVSTLSNGIYFLQINIGNATVYKKFVISR